MAYDDLHIEELMFKRAAGTISAAERAQLDTVLASNPEARRHWEQIEATLQEPPTRQFLAAQDTEQGWQDLSARLEPPSPRLRWYQYAAMATAVAAIAVSVWYFRPSADGLDYLVPDIQSLVHTPDAIQLQPEGGKAVVLGPAVQTLRVGSLSVTADSAGLRYAATAAAPQWATLHVPAQQQYRIDLPDGTKVWLNAATSLRFPSVFNTATRAVFLTGEAYFEVAADAGKPFVVHTPTHAIRVLGTAFNVKAYEDTENATALVAGSVQLMDETQALATLKPGEQAVYANHRATITPFDATMTLAWRDGLHYFYNATLGDIAPVLARWYGVKVRFVNQELTTRPFSGSIDKSQPLQDFIDNLQSVAGIQPYIRRGVLYFR